MSISSGRGAAAAGASLASDCSVWIASFNVLSSWSWSFRPSHPQRQVPPCALAMLSSDFSGLLLLPLLWSCCNSQPFPSASHFAHPVGLSRPCIFFCCHHLLYKAFCSDMARVAFSLSPCRSAVLRACSTICLLYSPASVWRCAFSAISVCMWLSCLAFVSAASWTSSLSFLIKSESCWAGLAGNVLQSCLRIFKLFPQ